MSNEDPKPNKNVERSNELIKDRRDVEQTFLKKANEDYRRKDDLFCITRDINLFVFLCDVNHIPNKILNTKVKIILPKHLPHPSSKINHH